MVSQWRKKVLTPYQKFSTNPRLGPILTKCPSCRLLIYYLVPEMRLWYLRNPLSIFILKWTTIYTWLDEKYIKIAVFFQCLVTNALIQGCLLSKTDKFDWLRR